LSTKIDDKRLPSINDWFSRSVLGGSKASISIVAVVVGLNAESFVGGPWLILPLDHPLLSHGAIVRVDLNLVAFIGAVARQIEHQVCANVSDSIHSIVGERHYIRCRSSYDLQFDFAV